jgi:SAM-dependent methyltransferase
MMDLPANPQDLLEDDLRNLRAINRYLGGYRGVLRGLARLIGEQKLDAFSLLDVGTGSGDIPVAIARWGRKRGVGIKIVALEPEPTIARVAAKLTQQRNPPGLPRSREKTRSWFDRLTTNGMAIWKLKYLAVRPEPVEGRAAVFSQLPLLQRGKEGDFRSHAISVVRGDATMLPFSALSFDFILASQLLHHFSEEEIVTLLRIWSGVARKAILVSDLVRHPVAYYGIRLLTRLATRNAMTLTDAPRSVQRAFTLPEWRELFSRAAIGPFEILPVFPFRMVAIFSVAGSISLPSSPSLEGED